MQDVFSSPEAMNAASPLLHALRELSDSLSPSEKREAEDELIRKLINIGSTPIHTAASHDGPFELVAVQGRGQEVRPGCN